jgi:hypothetical protein
MEIHAVDLVDEVIEPEWKGGVERTETKELINYLRNITIAVQLALAQISKSSSFEAEKTHKSKERYRHLTQESADLQKWNGKIGLITGVCICALAIARLGLAEVDSRFLGTVSEQVIPNVKSLFDADSNAKVGHMNAMSSLELQDYTNKNNAKGNADNSKQAFNEIIRSLTESLKTASRLG